MHLDTFLAFIYHSFPLVPVINVFHFISLNYLKIKYLLYLYTCRYSISTGVEIELDVTDMALSDFELEVMQLFWEMDEATAPQIHKIIAQRREAKYSTVKTIIDRLEKKHSLKRSRSEGRTIYYKVLTEKQSVRTPLIKDFINRVFLGKSRPLAAHILEQEELNLADIEYLESVLKERKKGLK